MTDGGKRNIRKGVLRGVKIVAVVVFVVIFLIWSLSPYVIRHYLAEALQEHDIQLDGGSSIRYNPLLSQVTVRDLNLVRGQKVVFHLGRADIELHLHRLLFSDIYINEFELSDLDLHIVMEESSINVAGFEIAPQNESGDEPLALDTAEQTLSAETDEEPFPYSVVGSLLRLSNSSITVLYQQTPYQFNIDDLSIKTLEASINSQVLEVGLKGRALGGDISFASEISMSGDKGEITNHLAVSDIQLQQIQPIVRDQLAMLAGGLNVKIQSNILLDGKMITASLNDSTASVKQFSAELPLGGNDKSDAGANGSINKSTSKSTDAFLNLNVDEYSLNIEQFDVHVKDGGLDQLTGAFDTALEELALINGNEDKLLALERLALGPINLRSGADIPSSSELSVGRLQVMKLLASHVHAVPSERSEKGENEDREESEAPSEEVLPPLLTISEAMIEAIRYQQEKLHIGDIAISDLRSHVFIAEDKSVSTLIVIPQGERTSAEAIEPAESERSENLVVAQVEEKDPAAEVDSEEPPSPPVFKMALGKLHLDGENHIIFKDESVTPHYNRDLKIDTLEISKVDSESNELSPFRFKGRSNDYAKIDLSGGVTPFSDKLNLKLKGDINEISLPAVSSYIRDSLGFELKSGQLDTALDVDIKNSDLGGSVKLNLRGVDMSAADDAMASMKDQGAIPLNVALGMLKDKRGNIKLSVPMSGSVNDPSFGVSSFLLLVTKKAVMSQAKSYLMNTFVPYASVVSVAISAGEFALKLRFEDLIYSAGHTELDEVQVTYAKQFIQLMKDKEKTQIKICGIATPEELGLPKGEEIKDEKIRTQLKALAKQRGENFKRYVVKEGEIESSRMLLCNPEIDASKKAQPRITLSI
ncbi:MAG: DUF748 domain-containing protein [Agarilytica sp.]